MNEISRLLSQNFKWIFTSLRMLSPPVNEKGGEYLPFHCINNLIGSEEVRYTDLYPAFVIEFERMYKVIQYAKLGVSRIDLMSLIDASGWRR